MMCHGPEENIIAKNPPSKKKKKKKTYFNLIVICITCQNINSVQLFKINTYDKAADISLSKYLIMQCHKKL